MRIRQVAFVLAIFVFSFLLSGCASQQQPPSQPTPTPEPSFMVEDLAVGNAQQMQIGDVEMPTASPTTGASPSEDPELQKANEELDQISDYEQP